MANFVAYTGSRDEFIAVNNDLAGAILTLPPAQRVVSVTGDSDAGKSLIALTMAYRISPERFPHGLDPAISADSFLSTSGKTPLKTLFSNYDGFFTPTKSDFDATLEIVKARNPETRFFVLANIQRPAGALRHHNYSIDGLISDHLDIALYVKKQPGKFNRRIKVTAENPALVRQLRRLAKSPRSPLQVFSPA